MNVIFQSFGVAQIKFTLIAWDLSKSWRLTPKLDTWLDTDGDMLKSTVYTLVNWKDWLFTEVDLSCVKHLWSCATDLGYHHWLRLKIICQGCTGKDGALVTLGSASTASSWVRGCIIHVVGVGVLSAAPAVAVCFLSPVCADLMVCHSARLCCLIQVSCNLTLLFSRPVRNSLIGLLFF